MVDVTVDGAVAPGFEPVAAAFERNFTEHGDCGASFALYVEGECKVDLWGGTADVKTGRPWERDTIALVYSATKGATAVLTSLLAQRGQLKLDAPVAECWPEFAAEGKSDITVRQVLSHQAGLAGIDADLTREQLIAGRPVVEQLARQAPTRVSGTSHGYHALTFGWLVGEIVRRTTGSTVGSLFATELAAPLNLDFAIGLAPSEIGRVAQLVNPASWDMGGIDAIEDEELKTVMKALVAVMSDQTSLSFRVMTSNGVLPGLDADTWNDPQLYAIEQPAVNGITNARSLARLYAACVSEVDGNRVLSEDGLLDATTEQCSGPDAVNLVDTRFGTGFMLPSPWFHMLSDTSFGHLGLSGALGFADRTQRVGFGYVPNRLGGGPAGDPRTAGLLDAVRTSLGMS